MDKNLKSEISEAKKGKFTSWVKKNMPGSSTCDAASKIIKVKRSTNQL